MKIAFLTAEYPHPFTGSSGGIGSSIKNLATGLVKMGVPVRVLVYGQTIDSFFYESGIQIQTIKNIKVKGLSRFLTQKKIERIINNLYREKKISAVEVADWTGFTSFIRPKICPILIRLHGSDTYFCHLENRRVKWLNKFHEKRALKNASAHISVSQFTADVTNRIFSQNINYSIIPNGIDTNNFKPFSGLVANESPIILYLGTIIRKKGVMKIPEIFNEVVKYRPNARLILIGKDASDALTGTSSTWSIMKEKFNVAAINNVEYKGSVHHEEVRDILIEADICIFPSFAEAFPVSWLEAMSMGKAIVASDIGWAIEMIEDGFEGFLKNPNEHKDYAEAIIQLLQDEKLRSNFGFRARQKIESEFKDTVIAAKYIEFYKKNIDSYLSHQ